MASSCAITFIGSGEPKEIVKSAECGYVVKPGDIDNIALSISRLINDKKHREIASQNARRFVVKNFNRKKIMARLMEDLKSNENS